jgi:hypothetical protein
MADGPAPRRFVVGELQAVLGLKPTQVVRHAAAAQLGGAGLPDDFGYVRGGCVVHVGMIGHQSRREGLLIES